MANFNFSAKHIAIDKSNTQIVAVVGAASFIVVFCLVASKAVFSQYQYQSRVIKAVNVADTQLKDNISAYNNLANSYTVFNSATPTVPGDKDNAQVILDALPGEYDFPALTSSIEVMLNKSNMQVASVTGNDQQVAQHSSSSSPNSLPISMPFGFSVDNADYGSVQQLVQSLQQSIRPILVDNLNINVSQQGITMTIAAHSYYQPSKTLSITKEAVK
jgi:hypothetical protein